jgi:hypothetical protein
VIEGETCIKSINPGAKIKDLVIKKKTVLPEDQAKKNVVEDVVVVP